MKFLPLFMLLICMLKLQNANGQDEAQITALFEQRQNEIFAVWHPSIVRLRERYASGDKSIGDSLDNLLNAYGKVMIEYYRTFIIEFPNTQKAAGLLSSFYFDAPFDTLISVYDKLGPVAKESESGRRAAAFIERGKKLLPGISAPQFSHPDTSGNAVHLSDFRGKYVLLEFWASWCKPCRAENPNLKVVYEKYHSKGFDILSISIDEKKDKQKWIRAIHDDGLPWQQVSSLNGLDNEVFALYNVMPIPDNYLIDPEGKIVARGIRGEALQEKLASIFNNR